MHPFCCNIVTNSFPVIENKPSTITWHCISHQIEVIQRWMNQIDTLSILQKNQSTCPNLSQGVIIPYMVKNNKNKYWMYPKSIRFIKIPFSFWITSNNWKLVYFRFFENLGFSTTFYFYNCFRMLSFITFSLIGPKYSNILIFDLPYSPAYIYDDSIHGYRGWYNTIPSCY